MIDRMATGLVLLILAAGVATLGADETESQDYVPKLGEFPPPGSGHHLAGELVTIDPINRRGGLRLDGDFTSNRYHVAQPHEFAMLPFGMIWYQGAPAELRDIPLGTHLHGTFYLPLEGEEETLPKHPQPRYASPYNHALLLEDDFSFYQRRGQAWKVEQIDREAGRLHVVAVGEPAEHGLGGEQSFWIDSATRVWREDRISDWLAIEPGQEIQVNLNWSPQWENRQFRAQDVWVDAASRAAATERQRRVHVRFQKYRWLAGWVDEVEHLGGSRGIVTLTVFGGMDESLYDELRTKQAHGLGVAAAEVTLRAYWHDHDHKFGRILELREHADPPPGSSGIQIRWQTNELLEGYRPNRIVRVRLSDWPRVKSPPEERLNRIPSLTPSE